MSVELREKLRNQIDALQHVSKLIDHAREDAYKALDSDDAEEIYKASERLLIAIDAGIEMALQTKGGYELRGHDYNDIVTFAGISRS